MIRAVTLDVGGTLIEPWPSVGHVYADEAARHGHPGLDPGLLTRRFQQAWRRQSQQTFRHSREEWAALVDQTFNGLIDPPPSQTFFSALLERFSQPEAWRIHDDVLPTLRALQTAQIPAAVLSNWDCRLRVLLNRLGLAPFFTALVISAETPWTKPHPAIFRHTALALRIQPENILHVGDEFTADWIGARRAGYNARLIDRHQTTNSSRSIHSLTHLITLMRHHDT